MNGPALRVLSLGAGVQSTALLLLAAENPKRARLDAAIFADTGWEPAAVYAHLDRLEAEVARPAGIPVYRVSVGNIRDDALDPAHRFASMPLYTKAAPGEPCPACGGDRGTPGRRPRPHRGLRAAPVADEACCKGRGDGLGRTGSAPPVHSRVQAAPDHGQVRGLLGAKPKPNGGPAGSAVARGWSSGSASAPTRPTGP